MMEYVLEHEFVNRFAIMDRKENFSVEGRQALFAYFEQLEEDTGEEIQFDCIAICCEYNEYVDIQDFRQQQEGYKGTYEDYEGQFTDMEAIEECTQVIRIEGSERFITQVF